MDIGRKDVLWNYVATFMRVASGIILLPVVLNKLSGEDVGLWNIFLQIGGLALLLDFGFLNSFGRNVTYIFSGVKELKAQGYVSVDENDKSINYDLLKSVISAMRRYYGALALFFLLIFLASSPFYFTKVLNGYHGEKSYVWIAWILYGVLVAYQLYTYYYSSLLSGRGMVKKLQQIIVIGQTSRIVSSLLFLFLGYGIMSLVFGQLISDIVNRILCYNAFYDKDLRLELKKAFLIPMNNIMKVMAPNALKIGVTTVGWFLMSKVAILVAPLINITLPTVGSYGTTKQMIDLTMSLGTIWFSTFYPKITLSIVNERSLDIKRMYVKSKIFLLLAFVVCGLGLIFIVPGFFNIIHSKTQLLPWFMILIMLFFAFFESNQGIATGFLMAGNEIPFMKSSLLTGFVSVVSLLVMLKFTSLNVWAMILAPAIAASIYQNWKWPLEVVRKLSLTPKEYLSIAVQTIKNLKIKN
ncbi:putative membrane protein [uncultured Paludibacter sp.]|uniref:Putative membrane protein n=1 Tax=uncultured Paludibacter sp. TaxID=497635 RepID=A0A653ABQ2_9BACT|nr:putative membrane protein [uncultured Paludibacter sp.]